MPKIPITPAIFAMIFFTLISPGCSKTGPQGPAGAQGSTGPAGPQGPQGPQGNANVLVDTFTLASSDWLWNSQYSFSTSPGDYTSYFTRYHDQSFSKVTQDVLSTGEVLVYFRPYAGNTNQWAPLPYSFLAFGGQYYINIVFETFVGKVRLHYFYTSNGSGTPPSNLSTATFDSYQFKIVAVSGTISTGMQHDHVNIKNYNDVSNYLGL